MKSHDPIILNSYQKQALIGNLLGDSTLNLSGGAINANFSITRAIKDKEYLKYEAGIFENLLAPSFKNSFVKETSYFSKKLNRINYECYFRTSRNPTFTYFYKKWYPNGIKVVPKDLELTPIIMAHWIADDGCIQFPKLPYRFVINLSTDGFSKSDTEFLISLLENRYGQDFYLKKSKYFSIRCYDTASRKIISDIDPYFKMKRKRFWDNPKTRFYENIPREQKHLKRSIEFQKKLVEKILNTRNEISLKELFNVLGHTGKVSCRKIKFILDYYKNNLIKEYEVGRSIKFFIKK